LNTRLLYSYLFFVFITGSAQIYLSFFHYSNFEALKDIVAISLLWTLPVIIFPHRAKKITLFMGIPFVLLALPSVFYAIIYKQELTQSLFFIIFESNIAESKEYLQNYFSLSVFVLITFYLIVCFYLWKGMKNFEISNKTKLILSAIILTLVFTAPTKRWIKRGSFDAFTANVHRHMSVASPYQLIGAYFDYQREIEVVERNLNELNQNQTVSGLVVDEVKTPETHVVVIGESTSRLHMSLYGYKRKTNPKLESIKDELEIFTNVFSSRPNTIESLSQVLTFADQQKPDLYKTEPTLMSILKQAGYKIYWVSNQQTLTTRNTMLTSFAKQADAQFFLNNARSQNSYSFDEKVFKPYQELLNNQDEKKIIFVHLIGTHMSYKYRYPETFKFFNDDSMLNNKIPKDKVERINHYDNAVLYNDHVVYELIDMLKTANIENSSLVYFSDHGEEVYDVGDHQFQGRNEATPTLGMYAIPFFFWVGDNEKLKSKFNKPSMFIRQYNNSDFIYSYTDFLGIKYDKFLSHESLLSDDFLQDSIIVGDPYSKKLEKLDGTDKTFNRH